MKLLRGLAWGLLPSAMALAAASAQVTSAQIRFTYQNSQLQPQRYVVTVQEDGAGSFHSEVGGGSGANEAESTAAVAQDRAIHISKAQREMMFASARKNKLFAFACEDKEKNIAYQGTKTLEYEGPEGKGSCTYNWSKNSQIQKLTDQFEAVATTLEEGGKLQRQYEHGRLSLDVEIEFLEQMAHEGRATEIENIAPLLQTLVNDEGVLQRVQRRAKMLLQTAKSD